MKPDSPKPSPKIITIIPAKPFSEAKTRLGPVLSSQQRVVLGRFLLERTVSVARQIGPVAVVSRSAAVRHLAKAAGAWALAEAEPDLNAAIRQGIHWAAAHHAEAVLILPTDLPHLTAADLRELVAQAEVASPVVALAPCRHGTGTNALFLRPPGLIDPHFGKNSFSRHCDMARRAGLEPVIVRTPGLAFDLDTPLDWQTVTTWAMQNLSDNPTNSHKP